MSKFLRKVLTAMEDLACAYVDMFDDPRVQIIAVGLIAGVGGAAVIKHGTELQFGPPAEVPLISPPPPPSRMSVMEKIDKIRSGIPVDLPPVDKTYPGYHAKEIQKIAEDIREYKALQEFFDETGYSSDFSIQNAEKSIQDMPNRLQGGVIYLGVYTLISFRHIILEALNRLRKRFFRFCCWVVWGIRLRLMRAFLGLKIFVLKKGKNSYEKNQKKRAKEATKFSK